MMGYGFTFSFSLVSEGIFEVEILLFGYVSVRCKLKSLLSKTSGSRSTAKDEQKYQPVFLLVFTGSRVTKSQVY